MLGMPIWVWIVVAVSIVARIIYNSLIDPHGSVVRVRGGCRYCGASTPGGHIVCNCGAVSQHFYGGQFLARRAWRRSHRRQAPRRK